jgi:hypothetical protein
VLLNEQQLIGASHGDEWFGGRGWKSFRNKVYLSV